MTTTDVAAGFAAELRTATAAQHELAETTVFVDRMLGGELGVAGYLALATQHHAIYRTLEAATTPLRDDPVLGAFFDDRLLRTATLEADLAALRAAAPDAHVEVLPATRAYTARIEEVAASWPTGLVAHHYTRYLGDLSGGLYIGRVLARSFPDATSFYRFDAIEHPKAWKDAYRAALDAAPWDADERARIVAETKVAYDHNHAVFVALDELTRPAA